MSDWISFSALTPKSLALYAATRPGEDRLGQHVTTQVTDKTKYIIIGIEESIGPRMNKGFSGAENAFHTFLSRFLTMQSTRFCSGEEIAILGSVQVDEDAAGEGVVEELDRFIFQLITKQVDVSGKKLIIIGGGHNNAFPIIQSISILCQRPLAVLNVDPHADCRSMEFRHSGNPFSFALSSGHLKSYTVLGLHKAYNNRFIYEFLEQNNCTYSFFESYLTGARNFIIDVDRFLNTHADQIIGLEIDMDSIQGMPASAFTPSGFELNEIRKLVLKMKTESGLKYMHLPEAAPKTADEERVVGKALAYLVYDFVSE
jgi:formiminoglutamase